MDLFALNSEANWQKSAPLADRLRPETLTDFVGQEQVVGEGKLLRQALEQDQVPSLIFWGPPGSGKTTLARIIAKATKATFVVLHAVTSGVKELRAVIAAADERQQLYGKKTVVFIDEIHRWSKSQQDALLPHVEKGTIALIGATTENPSFEVVSPLLSRTRVVVLQKLKPEHIALIIERAMRSKEHGLGNKTLRISPKTLHHLAEAADGDARVALNALEFASQAAAKRSSNDITQADITDALQDTYLRYDKGGEEHFNIISALHKSMRGSDPSAAVYWLARMLEAGEDPQYVARRLIRFAAEDIGLADPQALSVAVAGQQAAHFIGMPECTVVMAEVVAYLANAPKDNSCYEAYKSAQQDIHTHGTLSVPLHLRNAPTKLMKEEGYSKGYKYNPDYQKKGKSVEQQYLPDELEGTNFFD